MKKFLATLVMGLSVVFGLGFGFGFGVAPVSAAGEFMVDPVKVELTATNNEQVERSFVVTNLSDEAMTLSVKAVPYYIDANSEDGCGLCAAYGE